MNYLEQPLWFKIVKVARYVRMYGPSRTYIKIRAQVHMHRPPTILQTPAQPGPTQWVGMVGCGNYAFSHIAYYLSRRFGPVVGACMDVDVRRAASLSRYYHVPLYTGDAKEVTRNPAIRLVYIASNHASHAEYAIDALRHGKDVYIEKPHVVNEDQLERLTTAILEGRGRVFLGFNRPDSVLGRRIRHCLDRENGAGIYNWFVAGHQIDPDHWYFKKEEGGRVLGNLCHWTDFILRLVPDGFPVQIRPTRAVKSDSDIVVTFTFADDSIAVISFSAKGHVFEGVSEQFNAHRGDCLLSLRDYECLTVQQGRTKRRYRGFFRDHGHSRNITSAYRAVNNAAPYDADATAAYVWNTGLLFLKTREALEEQREVVVHSFNQVHATALDP